MQPSTSKRFCESLQKVGAKLYQTGGGTALHACAEHGCAALLRRVLEAAGGADAPADGRAALLAARDFDGPDAFSRLLPPPIALDKQSGKTGRKEAGNGKHQTPNTLLLENGLLKA